MLRVYERDSASLTKERRLLERRWRSFRVTSVLEQGSDFLVLEFIPLRPIPDAAGAGASPGAAAAEIYAVPYGSGGFLDDDLEIRESLPDVSSYVRTRTEELRPSWEELEESILHALRGLELTGDVLGRAMLNHGDFKVSNLILGPNDELVVLDWEFAFAGPALFDVGQLFRWGTSSEFRVSTAAVQIARLAGARVLVVTSGQESAVRLEELGADRVIDRVEEDFSRVAWEETGKRGVDVVLDSVGEAMWEGCVRALAKEGRLVTYGATTGAEVGLDVRRVFWKQIQVMGTTMATHAEFLRVMGLVFEGRLRPVVDVVWPMDRIRDAHARLEGGNQFGKVVLEA